MNDYNFDLMNNLPKNLISLINSHLNELKKEYKKEKLFLNSEERYYSVLETPVKDDLELKLAESLFGRSFISYHSTRLLYDNDVLNYGLNILDVNKQRIRVYLATSQLLNDKQKKIFNQSFDNYTPNMFGHRENQIWFVSNLCTLKQCSILNEYYGGEITRRVLGDNFILFKTALKVGYPVIIKCRIDIDSLKKMQLDALIEQIINAVLFKRNINFEFYLSKDISPSYIIEILKL